MIAKLSIIVPVLTILVLVLDRQLANLLIRCWCPCSHRDIQVKGQSITLNFVCVFRLYIFLCLEIRLSIVSCIKDQTVIAI